MNAPCSLNAIRVRANPEAARKFAGVTCAENGHPLRIAQDGRSLEVELPERGWIEFPLVGQPSWKTAWADDVIQIDICLHSDWHQIDDWEEFVRYIAAIQSMK